ncbi:tRNA-splicing ligase RtcB [Chromobacterium alkanivorans]|uniref:RtcB family protein n=1 Tax=Chromobacterium TaxID=535 RepID=UPI00065355A4|nr:MULTISPECIES: RtcB family protein [Chromobacterium]KMN81347.1 RNA ligase [Chromobacterium sp. LK11]MCS3804352.1 tRNA-splicing ligase RtcB [Chromobacterium alkanivorans]MCS3818428.1 tRNA-splicing ligase RtcB [Chromobacterium alkanivorans]MCS3873636.1 tRNA-splicing ligase RtcB [Chromobacterium alkanivorans]
MTVNPYQTLLAANGAPIKMWTQGVPVEDAAREQLLQTAQLPFIFRHLAVMPDVHLGKGSTIGSVIPTVGAVVPAAVGVDIGCGMMAARTTLSAADLPDQLGGLRGAIEAAVPHGRSPSRSGRDKGAWQQPPAGVDAAWARLLPGFDAITAKYPKLAKTNNRLHLGTLGTGNHFVEVCLDEADRVWFMLHSGSRGVGNAIGNLFIELAQADMRRHIANLPHRELAYFEEGSRHFDDYVEAVGWAQDYARQNRQLMMRQAVDAARGVIAKPFDAEVEAVNCHHNYVQRETHFGREVLVTRKGAVAAHKGQLGIIPGSMGAKSFIVRGLGNEEAFCSCSHGAGRAMSRSEAKRRFDIDDQRRATAHVECRKDAEVIDEIPMAYKDIDAVMAAQSSLVEVVHTLRQVVCVKG